MQRVRCLSMQQCKGLQRNMRGDLHYKYLWGRPRAGEAREEAHNSLLVGLPPGECTLHVGTPAVPGCSKPLRDGAQ